jgi:Rod binding domain-containing protein
MQARSQQVLQQATGAQNSGDKAKIAAAASQFESILLQKWLEDAEHSFAKVPGGDDPEDSADPGAGQFQSMAMQSLAEKMTASGGIGIARMIIKQLGSKNDADSSAQAVDSTQGTKGVLPPRNGIKVPSRKDR